MEQLGKINNESTIFNMQIKGSEKSILKSKRYKELKGGISKNISNVMNEFKLVHDMTIISVPESEKKHDLTLELNFFPYYQLTPTPTNKENIPIIKPKGPYTKKIQKYRKHLSAIKNETYFSIIVEIDQIFWRKRNILGFTVYQRPQYIYLVRIGSPGDKYDIYHKLILKTKGFIKLRIMPTPENYKKKNDDYFIMKASKHNV